MSQSDMLYFRNMVWNAAGVKQMFQSGIFHGTDTVEEVWRHRCNISYQGIRDVHFMQKRAMLMGARFAISEIFADQMSFSNK